MASDTISNATRVTAADRDVLKVLLAHNYYACSAPSGENIVFDLERALLKQVRGWSVIEHISTNDTLEDLSLWRKGLVGLRVPWNREARLQVKALINAHEPDVLHIHNVFPRLSPAIFYAAKDTETATVFTLHNYRVACANGLLLRKELPCTRCIDERSVMPALRYKCYRSSLPATIPVAASIALHRGLGTWVKQVDAFIALSGFQREVLIRAGIPAELVHLKHNFSPAEGVAPLEWSSREPKAMFVGRLTAEKGIRVLIQAWHQLGKQAPLLEVVGDGIEANQPEVRKAAASPRISFLGHLSFAEVQERMRKARMLIIPSISFEGSPLAVREAFGHGVPVVASRIGALPDLVRDGEVGVLFEPNNPSALAEAVMNLWGDPVRMEQMSLRARENFQAKYTAEVHLRSIMRIYSAAIEHRHETRRFTRRARD